MDIFLFVANIIGALGVFLYGLKVMSEGLQKAAGPKLRSILAKATNNRFMATLSGFIVTCAVQSSSATTVMVVGFCSAGLLNLYQSLGIIFGANIGTTTTAWIVSLLGFKVKIAKFAVPLIGLGFFSQFIKRWRTPHRIGEAIVGFGLLFLGLALLKNSIPNVKDAPQILDIISTFKPDSLIGLLYAITFGAALTAIVQSSSATMAITLTAAAKGLIDYETAAAMAIGQNIGTTVTAMLASISATLTARRAALGHLLFNVLGVVPVLIVFSPLLGLIDSLIPGNPYGTDEAARLAVTTHLALFHTVFNVFNTVLFLPFIRQFERLIIKLLPGKATQAKEHDLIYLKTPFADTPELAISAAQKEVERMAGITVRMIDKIKGSFGLKGSELQQNLEKILEDEKTTDVLEHKINTFLARLVHGRLSSNASKEALSLISMTNDLERIGDHGEKIAKLLRRKADGDYQFSKQAMSELQEMATATENILSQTKRGISHRANDPLPKALERERQLDELRDRFRQAHLSRLADKKCSPLAGILFTDFLTSFEKMGDHAYNVVEACAGKK